MPPRDREGEERSEDLPPRGSWQTARSGEGEESSEGAETQGPRDKEEAGTRGFTPSAGSWEHENPEDVQTIMGSIWQNQRLEIEEFLQQDHMQGLTFGPTMTEEQIGCMKALTFAFRDCFGEKGTVRPVRGTTMSLASTQGPPRRVPLRRLSGPLRDFVRDEIRKLLDMGYIRPSRSPWAAAVCLTPKVGKDGTKTWRGGCRCNLG